MLIFFRKRIDSIPFVNQRVQTVNRTSQHRGIYMKFTILCRCRYFLLLTLHFVH